MNEIKMRKKTSLGKFLFILLFVAIGIFWFFSSTEAMCNVTAIANALKTLYVSVPDSEGCGGSSGYQSSQDYINVDTTDCVGTIKVKIEISEGFNISGGGETIGFWVDQIMGPPCTATNLGSGSCSNATVTNLATFYLDGSFSTATFNLGYWAPNDYYDHAGSYAEVVDVQFEEGVSEGGFCGEAPPEPPAECDPAYCVDLGPISEIWHCNVGDTYPTLVGSPANCPAECPSKPDASTELCNTPGPFGRDIIASCGCTAEPPVNPCENPDDCPTTMCSTHYDVIGGNCVEVNAPGESGCLPGFDTEDPGGPDNPFIVKEKENKTIAKKWYSPIAALLGYYNIVNAETGEIANINGDLPYGGFLAAAYWPEDVLHDVCRIVPVNETECENTAEQTENNYMCSGSKVLKKITKTSWVPPGCKPAIYNEKSCAITDTECNDVCNGANPFSVPKQYGMCSVSHQSCMENEDCLKSRCNTDKTCSYCPTDCQFDPTGNLGGCNGPDGHCYCPSYCEKKTSYMTDITCTNTNGGPKMACAADCFIDLVTCPANPANPSGNSANICYCSNAPPPYCEAGITRCNGVNVQEKWQTPTCVDNPDYNPELPISSTNPKVNCSGTNYFWKTIETCTGCQLGNYVCQGSNIVQASSGSACVVSGGVAQCQASVCPARVVTNCGPANSAEASFCSNGVNCTITVSYPGTCLNVGGVQIPHACAGGQTATCGGPGGSGICIPSGDPGSPATNITCLVGAHAGGCTAPSTSIVCEGECGGGGGGNNNRPNRPRPSGSGDDPNNPYYYYHNVCDQFNQCVLVWGFGADACYNDTDCPTGNNYHTECSLGTEEDPTRHCILLPGWGTGESQCDIDDDCNSVSKPLHNICNNGGCFVKSGTGTNQCFSDSQCDTKCNTLHQCVLDGTGASCLIPGQCIYFSHNECNDCSCEVVNSAGIDLCGANTGIECCVSRCNANKECTFNGTGPVCSTDDDCIDYNPGGDYYHLECQGNQCEPVLGEEGEPDQCFSNIDCQMGCNTDHQCVMGGTGAGCLYNWQCSFFTHNECIDNECVLLDFMGDDLCGADTGLTCDPLPPVKRCDTITKQCSELGTGAECSENADCVTKCNLAKQCVADGTGPECSTNDDCQNTKCDFADYRASACIVGGEGPVCDENTDCQPMCDKNNFRCLPGLGINDLSVDPDTGSYISCSSDFECEPKCTGLNWCVPGGNGSPCVSSVDCGGDPIGRCNLSGQCVTNDVTATGPTCSGPDPEVSDCANSHNECIDEKCVPVENSGPEPVEDQCQDIDDCATHLECNTDKQCVPVAGSGADLCYVDSDCSSGHTECNDSDQCIFVNSPSPFDLCDAGTGLTCEPVITYCNDSGQCVADGDGIECSSPGDCGVARCNNSCQCLVGGDGNICSSESDCGMWQHKECLNQQCVMVDNTVQCEPNSNQCSVDAQCLTRCNAGNENKCEVGGAGPVCDADTDCQPKCAVFHNVCSNQACVQVQGVGTDQCKYNQDCMPACTLTGQCGASDALIGVSGYPEKTFCGSVNDCLFQHSECFDGVCAIVPWCMGDCLSENQCSENRDCAPEGTIPDCGGWGKCNSDEQCVYNGTGPECSENSDCAKRCNESFQCVVGGVGLKCSDNMDCQNPYGSFDSQDSTINWPPESFCFLQSSSVPVPAGCIACSATTKLNLVLNLLDTYDPPATNAQFISQMAGNIAIRCPGLYSPFNYGPKDAYMSHYQCVVGGTGPACIDDTECMPRCDNDLGECVIGGTGDYCSDNIDCQPTKCNDCQQCVKGGTGTSCSTNEDCITNCDTDCQCSLDGTGILCTDENSWMCLDTIFSHNICNEQCECETLPFGGINECDDQCGTDPLSVCDTSLCDPSICPEGQYASCVAGTCACVEGQGEDECSVIGESCCVGDTKICPNEVVVCQEDECPSCPMPVICPNGVSVCDIEECVDEPSKICPDGTIIPESLPCPPNCGSQTCGDWSECVNNEQTRECSDLCETFTDGPQPCCSNPVCGEWSECSPEGNQTQTCQDSCGNQTTNNQCCTIWQMPMGDWSECIDGTQTRSLIDNCGNVVVETQSCGCTPGATNTCPNGGVQTCQSDGTWGPCDCGPETCEWSACVNNQKTRTCSDFCGTRTDPPQPCCSNPVCGEWSECSPEGTQTQTCQDSCGNQTTNTQCCTIWQMPMGDWSECIDGTQTRSLIDNCGNVVVETQSCGCTPGATNTCPNGGVQTCQSDGTWGPCDCGPETCEWSACVNNQKTRTCSDFCGTRTDPPQPCCSNPVCGEWSECSPEGTQTQTCQDSCGNQTTNTQCCTIWQMPMGDWSECIDGTQTRSLIDNCGNVVVESRPCVCVPGTPKTCPNGIIVDICDECPNCITKICKDGSVICQTESCPTFCNTDKSCDDTLESGVACDPLNNLCGTVNFHNECVGLTCTVFAGPGTGDACGGTTGLSCGYCDIDTKVCSANGEGDPCETNSDCGVYLDCNDDCQCVPVPGIGKDKCGTSDDCSGPVCLKKNICLGQTCTAVNCVSPTDCEDQCLDNDNCLSHSECDENKECVSIPLPGIDGCQTDGGNNSCKNHNICNEETGKCEEVEGPGINLCEVVGGDCVNAETHKECDIEKQCVDVSGPGPQECPVDCALTHTECNRQNQCVVIYEDGFNTCDDDSDCVLSHTECNYFDQCVVVNEEGDDECFSDIDCIHTACELSGESCQCVQKSGLGINECTDAIECLSSPVCAMKTICEEDNQCAPVICPSQEDCQDNCTSQENCCPAGSHTECQAGKCICIEGIDYNKCQVDQNCSYQAQCIFQQCIVVDCPAELCEYNGCNPENGNADCEINDPPTATNLAVNSGDYCTGVPMAGYAYLSFDYKDMENDTGRSFQIQIDDNPDFLTPEFDPGVFDGMSMIVNAGDPTYHQDLSVKVLSQLTETGGDYIAYGVPYYWRVRVTEYNGNLSSEWVYYDGAKGTTDPELKEAFTYGYPHPAPYVNFNFLPEAPVIGENVTFFDLSRFFGSPSSYNWNFGDGSTSSVPIQTTHVYESEGIFNVTLTVCDDGGCCSVAKDIPVKNESSSELPKFKEIPPY